MMNGQENDAESEFELWRIHWRIAGEEGFVERRNCDRAKKSARNKVAHRALKASGLPPILDWQGMPGSQSCKLWVDQFIGAPIGLSSVSEIPTANERDSVPDVQLILDEVEVLFGALTVTGNQGPQAPPCAPDLAPRNGSGRRDMTAKEIDADGVWWDGEKGVPLLGSTLPVPKAARLRGETEEQEVMLLVKATGFVDTCHSCGGQLPDEAIILLTADAKMIPAHCCDTIIWMTDEEPYDGEDDA